MKITETITNSTITILLTSLTGLFGILLGSIYSEVVPIIFPTLTQKLPITVLLKILSAAIILLVLSIALSIFIYLKYKPKYKARFGVYWDKNKEAYCPSCKTYLSEYSERTSQKPPAYLFSCHTCDSLIQLKNIGIPISLQDAQKLL